MPRRKRDVQCSAALEARWIPRSRLLAQGQFRQQVLLGRQWRSGVVDRMAVLAVFLGDVERVVGGGDQPVRERTDLPGPLRDADRDRDRDIRTDAGLGILAADLDDAAGDHRAFPQGRGRQHHAELVAAGARQHVAGPNRVCAIKVKCCRQASPAAWP